MLHGFSHVLAVCCICSAKIQCGSETEERVFQMWLGGFSTNQKMVHSKPRDWILTLVAWVPEGSGTGSNQMLA